MKRYMILIFALLCALLLAGCAGGCNSCSSVTPPTIETVPPETNATEPTEEPDYIGIGLQEPKYIESKGVMSGKQAKAEKLGGELICTVW